MEILIVLNIWYTPGVGLFHSSYNNVYKYLVPKAITPEKFSKYELSLFMLILRSFNDKEGVASY